MLSFFCNRVDRHNILKAYIVKRRKQKLIHKKKSKRNYKCDACNSIFSTMKDYQNHVSDNLQCKICLPYSCQFCQYIGYEPYGFQKHLQCKPSCEQFYKEKELTTGQILDFSSTNVRNDSLKSNETSYLYKRFSASGIEDTVQLNLSNDTLSGMDHQARRNHLNNKKIQQKML